MTRLAGPTNCAGFLSGEFRVDADLGHSEIAIEIDSLDARQIAVVSPRWLGDDQLSIVHLNAGGKLELGPQMIQAHEFLARSELAHLEANGRFDLSELIQLAHGKQIPHSTFRLDAAVDLPKMASMLPGTMRLRDDVRLESGNLRIVAHAQDDSGQPRLIANAEATNMNFSVGNRKVLWHRPVRLVSVATRQQGRLRLEDLQLECEFLSLSGRAGLDQGHLQISADLEKATRQLGEVLDLGGFQLAGQADGDLQWNVPPTGHTADADRSRLPIALQGRFDIRDPALSLPGRPAWKQDRLAVVMAANALVAPDVSTTVDQARFDLQLGNESAVATLKEPIENVFDSRKLQFECQASGSLSNWLRHVRSLVDLPQFVADGKLSSHGLLTLNPRTCRLNQLRLEATDFSLDGFGLQIREPQLKVRTNLKYDYQNQSLLVTKGTLSTPAVAAETAELTVSLDPRLQMDGQVAYRADLRRASNWVGLSQTRGDLVYTGSATGSLDLSPDSGDLAGALRLKLDDLVVLKPTAGPAPTGFQTASSQVAYGEVWREPVVMVSSQWKLREDFDAIQIDGFSLQSSVGSLRARGTLQQLTGVMIADLSGQSKINWDNVNQTIRAYLGDLCQFEGSDWQPFTVQGPLLARSASSMDQAWVPLAISASASVDWNRAALFKMPVGPSRIDVTLERAQARLSSSSASGPLGQVMRLQPVIDLHAAEPVLIMGRGRLLDHCQISATDSRSWMKYMAPLMADATRAEGAVSIDLEEMQVPLLNPAMLTAAGRIEVHQLTVGPGPLTRQLSGVVHQLRALLDPSASGQKQAIWLQIKPQTVPIVVRQGRVQHQGLQWQFNEITVYTRGSVGFDQSLDLTAELPIHADWLGDRKELSLLAGKKISIPVSGTLTRPRIDPQIVNQLTRKLFQEAAVGTLNEKLNDGVGRIREKLGRQVEGELNRLDGKANRGIQDEVENQLRSELRKGLSDLLGGDGDLP